MKYRSRSRLQWVQNALARITVPQNSSFPISSTTALLQHLHRLPIDSRMYQFQTIYNKHSKCWAPTALHILEVFSTTTALLEHSSSTKLLTVLSLGSHAFHISAPTTWNLLPHNVHECLSLASFWNHLKTHYLSSAFYTL